MESNNRTVECPTCGRVCEWDGQNPGGVAQCGCGCYFELPGDPNEPQCKHERATALHPDSNTVIGYLVDTRKFTGNIAAFLQDPGILTAARDSDQRIAVSYSENNIPLGYLDAKTAKLIHRSKAKNLSAKLHCVKDNKLWIAISANSPIWSDGEYHQKTIMELPDKFPEFKGLAFGWNPPTYRQFEFALKLDIPMRGQTFENISRDIDQAKAAKRRRTAPMPNDFELKLIYEYLCRWSFNCDGKPAYHRAYRDKSEKQEVASNDARSFPKITSLGKCVSLPAQSANELTKEEKKATSSGKCSSPQAKPTKKEQIQGCFILIVLAAIICFVLYSCVG